MANYLHLAYNVTLHKLSAGATTIDLANSSGTSAYNVIEYHQGVATWKRTLVNSPLIPLQLLVAAKRDIAIDEIELSITGTTLDAFLTNVQAIENFIFNAQSAQIDMNRNSASIRYFLAVRPLNTATYTMCSEILWGELEKPSRWFNSEQLVNKRMDGALLRLYRDSFWTRSI